ncbi:zeta toxin family protein [Deinococcus marmoris]|uniref:Zeta toxin domain-containing protein n=1 Tax=Deinococcus marmoris TaxID=249408 RepID=A0A1U7NW56_9DEIO|nr:zeta toxin family protein [Deinococcus marmoris]OLV17140.1 hypothetical protein BOO71_0009721 [Deinococcus marmoris]
MPTLTVIAGENGAGKSTLVKARGLQTIDPDQLTGAQGRGFNNAANVGGARAALQAQEAALAQRQSFAVETTLSARQPLTLMDRARAQGYDVHLAFIIPHPGEDTRLRIDNRVLQGGHNISDRDLKRRLPRVLENLPEAMKRADVAALYVSAEKSSDFVMVGAMHQGQLTVTPQLPGRIRTALEREFPQMQTAESIGRSHAVTQQFSPHVQRDLED